MSNMVKIVHCKKSKYDIYCGRPSIYGNIYIIGKDGNRAEVINKYKIYFDNKIKNDPEFKKAILKLRNKTISCWCDYPKQDCHLRIIAEYLDSLDNELQTNDF